MLFKKLANYATLFVESQAKVILHGYCELLDLAASFLSVVYVLMSKASEE